MVLLYCQNFGILILYVDKEKKENYIYILVYIFDYHDRRDGGIFITPSFVCIMVKDHI